MAWVVILWHDTDFKNKSRIFFLEKKSVLRGKGEYLPYLSCDSDKQDGPLDNPLILHFMLKHINTLDW